MEIRALLYQFGEEKKEIALKLPHMRGVPIILDFSLQVKRHKRDKYESNFIYTHTRTRYSRAARTKLRTSFSVCDKWNAKFAVM